MTDPLKSMETNTRTGPSSSSSSSSPPVSKKSYPIAGIITTVFGLDELPPQASEVACLWLLHPRLGTQERMTGIAVATISDWNGRIRDGRAGASSSLGLIAVSFDQRNHGTRMVDPLANESWKQGNPRHAQDMFSIFHGTARDVSILMDHLPSYIFPKTERKISDHLVLGVSLGGHATWNCILHEPRVTTGVVIIGCPDYVNLMADRARLSKLPSWTSSDPPGSQFLGSEAFPSSLLETVRKYDPASLFLSHTTAATSSSSSSSPLRNGPLPEPTTKEKDTLRPLLSRCLAGKRIMNLSGGVDKLVPYRLTESILAWLKNAIAPGGWFGDGAVTLEDIIDENAGHEVTPKMADEAVRFISESLAAAPRGDSGSGQTGFVRESKI